MKRIINSAFGTAIASGVRQGDELGKSVWVALTGKVILVIQLGFGLVAAILLYFIIYIHIYFLVGIKYYVTKILKVK